MGKGIVVVNGKGAANAASVSDDASCRAFLSKSRRQVQGYSLMKWQKVKIVRRHLFFTATPIEGRAASC
jgi:hypothetical protein